MEDFSKDDLDLIKNKDLEKQLWEHPNLSKSVDSCNSQLRDIYKDIIERLRYYCDIEEKYYSLIALWIIGTYYHNEFPTYPYLFLNATKGSGKSRLLRLITYLAKDGCMLNSLTEAVLFRTKGCLGIDEFEGVGRKGNESLKELLNSAYKRGIKVKRMKKVKKFDGEEQVPEEFDVYRPIAMANINGMEEVLGDRCIQVIISKSSNPKIIKKMEIYENDTKIKEIKDFPYNQCRLCRVVALSEMYISWNTYIDNLNDTNNTNIINNTNNTNDTTNIASFFKEINDSEIDGRNLELMFPILFLASFIGRDTLLETIEILKEIVKEKKKDDLVEGYDNMVIDFVSQQLENKWMISKELLRNFRDFIQTEEEWINEKWLGKALKRLSLIQDKKRLGYGRVYLLNVQKAQEKIGMFK